MRKKPASRALNHADRKLGQASSFTRQEQPELRSTPNACAHPPHQPGSAMAGRPAPPVVVRMMGRLAEMTCRLSYCNYCSTIRCPRAGPSTGTDGQDAWASGARAALHACTAACAPDAHTMSIRQGGDTAHHRPSAGRPPKAVDVRRGIKARSACFRIPRRICRPL